jgi:hypothetical protein
MKIGNKFLIVCLVCFIFIGLTYNIYNDHKRQKLFQNSKNTIGILIEESHSSQKFLVGYFYYYVGKKKFKIREKQNFSHLKKGDTVLIRYAVEDPSVARVIDKYYMQKYKHLAE